MTDMKHTCNGCSNCFYVCEGDFFCTRNDNKEPLIIISDWIPTKNYCWCKRKYYI